MELSIMSFKCEMCGLEVKIIPKDKNFSFYILEHYQSKKEVLDKNGFLKCTLCNHTSKLRFYKYNF